MHRRQCLERRAGARRKLSVEGGPCERCVELGITGQAAIVSVVRTVVRKVEPAKSPALVAVLPTRKPIYRSPPR